MKNERCILNKYERTNHEVNGTVLILRYFSDKIGGGYKLLNFRGRLILKAYSDGGDCISLAIGEWIKQNFENELKKIKKNPKVYELIFRGLLFYNPNSKKYNNKYSEKCSIIIKGGYGEECIKEILNKIGFNLIHLFNNELEMGYIIESL